MEKDHIGYYSVVQYCPNVSRMEVINVGVVLLVPELNFFEVMMSKGNKKIRSFFEGCPSNCCLNKMKETFKGNIKNRGIIDLESLNHYIGTRMNSIIMTSVKTVRVDFPHTVVTELFQSTVQ